jgi:DNA-binding transcriptional LysR family regulator
MHFRALSTVMQITQRAAARVATTYFATGNEWFFEGPEGQESVRTRSAFRCNNGDTCRMITLAGGGISLQPSFMVADDLTRGDLVEVLPGYSSVELGIYAVYPSRKHVAPKVRALISYLSERLASPSWERPRP